MFRGQTEEASKTTATAAAAAAAAAAAESKIPLTKSSQPTDQIP